MTFGRQSDYETSDGSVYETIRSQGDTPILPIKARYQPRGTAIHPGHFLKGLRVARISIEEIWWNDPRRSALARVLGGQAIADGAAMKLWRVGQEYWKQNQLLIPEKIFNLLEGAQATLGVGLATLGKDGVYVAGSREWFDWLEQSKRSGSIGGKKSAQRPRDSKGRLQKNPRVVQGSLGCHPSASKPLPPPPPPPLPLTHTLKEKTSNFQFSGGNGELHEEAEHTDPKRIGALIDGMLGKLQ